MYFIHEQFHH